MENVTLEEGVERIRNLVLDITTTPDDTCQPLFDELIDYAISERVKRQATIISDELNPPPYDLDD